MSKNNGINAENKTKISNLLFSLAGVVIIIVASIAEQAPIELALRNNQVYLPPAYPLEVNNKGKLSKTAIDNTYLNDFIILLLILNCSLGTKMATNKSNTYSTDNKMPS